MMRACRHCGKIFEIHTHNAAYCSYHCRDLSRLRLKQDKAARLAFIIRKRLRTLALEAPDEWRPVMLAEADAIADIICEFNQL